MPSASAARSTQGALAPEAGIVATRPTLAVPNEPEMAQPAASAPSPSTKYSAALTVEPVEVTVADSVTGAEPFDWFGLRPTPAVTGGGAVVGVGVGAGVPVGAGVGSGQASGSCRAPTTERVVTASTFRRPDP